MDPENHLHILSHRLNTFFVYTLDIVKISPLVGLYKCNRERPTVVLPQPDSPTNPSVSPGLIAKDTPSTAFKGIVLPNPALIGKYCFRLFTSTRYSLFGTNYHSLLPAPFWFSISSFTLSQQDAKCPSGICTSGACSSRQIFIAFSHLDRKHSLLAYLIS